MRRVDDPRAFSPQDALDDTLKFWREWSGRNKYKGPYGDVVCRSLITLKGMTYKPSGGIVAAVTTSLPEKIGGNRNWDYRYCWLRDTSFTLLVLLRAGYEEEATAWRRWLLRAIAGAPCAVADDLRYMRRASAGGVGGGLAAGLREFTAGEHRERCLDAVSAGCVWGNCFRAHAYPGPG